MSPEDLKNVFDPYFSTKPGSQGLGLAIAASIIKKHGGNITVDSEPGKGSLFGIYLPAVDQPATAAAARRFDLVIMDLTVPGAMGGGEAVRILGELDRDVRAVVSSGYSNDPVMSHFREYGFCDVLSKPYRVQEIQDLLSRVLF